MADGRFLECVQAGGVSAFFKAAALLVLLLIAGCEKDAPPAGFVELEIKGKVFTLELALTDEARFQGLSDRESIPADGGMLFVFPDTFRREFVMRKCLVPIDILFLDATGRVVATHAMPVEPYDTPENTLKTYASRWPATFAIELKGGTLVTLNIQNSDTIDFNWRQLKQQAR